MKLVLRSDSSIYLIAIFASILLSISGFFRGSILNPDGICYLQSAANYSTASFSAAMHTCGQAEWPLYSYLIHLFVKFTSTSFFDAAFIINGLFSIISVITFIYITKLLGGSIRVMFFSALVILLAHEFNAVREYVIRDHGFWAFYLLSFVCLLQFLRKDNLIFALGWGCSLLIATLFRIEGAIFLLLVPFSVFCQFKNRFISNFYQFIKLNLLLMIVVTAGLIYLLMHANGLHIHRINEVQNQFTHGWQLVTNNFDQKANALAQNVLSVFSARDAKTVLTIMLITWLILSIITNVSVIYAFLFGYAFYKKIPAKDLAAKLSLYSYLIINVLIVAIFLAEHMFLSKRYLIALSLILMTWVPFALDYLLQTRRKFLFSLLVLLILLSSLGGIFEFGYSKKYLAEAGQWLEANTPANATIYSNDYQVMYYSNHFGNDIFAKANLYSKDTTLLIKNNWKQFDYIAIRINKQDAGNVHQLIPLKPIISFANKRGDKVIIFKSKS